MGWGRDWGGVKRKGKGKYMERNKLKEKCGVKIKVG